MATGFPVTVLTWSGVASVYRGTPFEDYILQRRAGV
jgi:hypothetical protein